MFFCIYAKTIHMNKFILSFIVVLMLSACSNYGKKVKEGHIEVYYKEGITTTEAEKTAKALYSADNEAGNEAVRKSFQLIRKGETITLRMVVDKQKAKDMGDENFSPIAALVAEKAFDGKPVDMELTDTKFKTLRSIAYKKETTEELNIATFGEKVTEGNTEVYYKGATIDEATRLAAYMNDYFKPETIYSFQLLKDDIENYTVKMVGNPDKINTISVSLFEEVCQGICDKVLSVPAITFEMTDTKFNALRTYNYPADTGDPDRNN
jgi:hypothetical protein